MRNVFGWSYPPGVSRLPDDEPCICAVCGEVDDNCICPECVICGSVCDDRCYPRHMQLSEAQILHAAQNDWLWDIQNTEMARAYMEER